MSQFESHKKSGGCKTSCGDNVKCCNSTTTAPTDKAQEEAEMVLEVNAAAQEKSENSGDSNQSQPVTKTSCCLGSSKNCCDDHGDKDKDSAETKPAKECCNKSDKSNSAAGEEIRQGVKEHYAKAKKCCAYKVGKPSTNLQRKFVNEIIAEIHPDVLEKYYGCGLAVPEFLDGARVLDVGCGGGRDVFIVSTLVGPKGEVVGIDMTEEMISTAVRHAAYHAEKFGFQNTRFIVSKIEDISAHLEPNTFDVVISNCVMNLLASKETGFEQVYRVLKPGGEVYFSDVYAAQAIPESVQKNALAWNECLSGALPWTEFVDLVQRIGFSHPYICSSADYEATHPDLESVLKGLKFWSRTVRLVKPVLQELTYNGGLKNHETGFSWDEEHHFPAGKPVKVQPSIAGVILGSRYAQFFQ
jgi:SAM-dependent methyltransferase